MFCDLKKYRTEHGLSISEMADIAEMSEKHYESCEEKSNAPCKYIYKIYSKRDDFPIPEDFFYFTSYTLKCNMKYHKISQERTAELFGYSNQSTISSILSENIPMYEMKEKFGEIFDPLIIPLKMQDGDLLPITELTPKGNFMLGVTRVGSRKAKQDVMYKQKEGKR